MSGSTAAVATSSFAFTQCYVSFGDPDGEDFAFTKCNADGTFTLYGSSRRQLESHRLRPVERHAGGRPFDARPAGRRHNHRTWATLPPTSGRRTSTPGPSSTTNGDGVSQTPTKPDFRWSTTNVRYRDGSFSNRNNTDLNGNAAFNEEFPLFNWYVVETDTTRYKNTGIHMVYDAGGPADGSAPADKPATRLRNLRHRQVHGQHRRSRFLCRRTCAYRARSIAQLRTAPGASIATGPVAGGSSGPGGSTGRIDPPWVLTEGWQGFSGQNNFLEFGKKPYAAGENGGIHGHVVYASTRPFDDPQLLRAERSGSRWFRTSPSTSTRKGRRRTALLRRSRWLTHTKTSSWDDWAQGFRSDGIPNMNCPGQIAPADLFYFTLYNQPNYLDLYNCQHGGPAAPHACRTTRSSSAMTACTTGTSCSRRLTTACTSSPASPA